MPLFDQQRLDNRLERFDKGIRSPRSASQRLESSNNDLAFQSKPMVDENGDVDWDAITIKGTSTKLEKDYLRLTQVCSSFCISVTMPCNAVFQGRFSAVVIFTSVKRFTAVSLLPSFTYSSVGLLYNV